MAKSFPVLLMTGLIYVSGCAQLWFPEQRAVERYVSAMSFHVEQQDFLALAELQAAVELDQDFSLAYSLMGDLYRQNGNLEQAVDAYENACRIDPWDFDDHLHLGLSYQELERFGEALKPLLRACFLQDDHTQANYALGICYYETEQYDDAVKYCRIAAQLAPDNPIILTSLGDMYTHNDDPNQAITAFKQALEIDDQQVEVMIRLGATYLDLEQFAPARLIFEKAAQTQPDQSPPYLALAYCLLVEGNKQLKWHSEQSKQLNQTQARIHYQQALHLYQQARQQYEAVHQIDPDNHLAHNGLGVACMMLALHDPDQKELAQLALQYWRRSLDLFPDQPKIVNLLEKYSNSNASPEYVIQSKNRW